MKYLRNVPLKKHTSFRIGGPADYFCIPKNIAELQEALSFASKNKLRLIILGAGTNILVRDRGFRGLVIKLARGLNSIKIEHNRVTAGAGVLLPRLLKTLTQKKLGGLEFLVGIPGTVGGAVTMNAGAWGKEIGGFVESVTVLDKNGNKKTVKKKSLRFNYRKSQIQGNAWIVTEVTLKLRRTGKKTILKKLKEFLDRRKKTQPLGSPNCGSVFKNPKDNFAGKLIEEAGCKGMRTGDAQVSDKHANFILNLGDAKAEDVIKLICQIQKAVKLKLEPEVKIV